jgi:hypothetical protein
LELIVKPLASIAGSLVLEESKLPECAGKRRPLVSETVIGPWHNEKTVRKDQPQFVWSLGTPVLPDKDGNFVLRTLAPGSISIQCSTAGKVLVSEIYVLARGCDRGVSERRRARSPARCGAQLDQRAHG